MTNIEQLQQGYAQTTAIDVKWGEMDAFQHINNVAYIRYLEDARLALFAKLGMLSDLTDSNKGPILASISCDYLAPVTYPDRIHVATNVKQTGAKKMSLEQVIYSEKLNRLTTKASSLIIYYDFTNQTSCAVSETVSQAIKELNED